MKARKIKLIEETESKEDVVVGVKYINYFTDRKLAEDLLQECFDYLLGNENCETEEYAAYGEEIALAIADLNSGVMQVFWDYFLNTGIFHDACGEVVGYNSDELEISYNY